MGNVFDKIMQKISNNSPKNILMLGLENAGKTTIIYRMKNIEDFNTVPTVGMFTKEFRFIIIIFFKYLFRFDC